MARSPFLASFLSLHFPNFHFDSSGIAAVPKTTFSSHVRQIAKQWGFDYQVSKCKSPTQDNRKIIFLPVETRIQQNLESEFKQNSVVNLTNYSNNMRLASPTDPLSKNDIDMRFELSKLLAFGAFHVGNINGDTQRENIASIIPASKNKYSQLFSNLKSKLLDGRITIVDASLKGSNYNLLETLDFEPEPLLASVESGKVYSQLNEVMESEKFYCSKEWRKWIYDLAEQGEVVIVAPPMATDEGIYICDSFLASIWAGSICIL
jgi:hypothetical protein